MVGWVALSFVCACGTASQGSAAETSKEPGVALSPAVEDTLGNEQPNACGGSVDRNLANLASAVAEELGRWQATRDFRLAADGASVELSAEGEARCRNGCELVRGVLALQQPDAVTRDNDPHELAGALVADWERQKAAENSSPSLEEHELARIAIEPSQCGNMFWFEAERANCSGECEFMAPDALQSKLLFAGFPNNPYLQFQSARDFRGRPKSVVGVDPTYGLTERGLSCAGTCTAACVVVRTNPISYCGWCCTCNGYTTTFKRSAWSPTTYVCQL